ncbi:MAG TPA: hypothetical protein VIL14_02895 [Nitrososphaeraceae archaeon]
MRISHDATEAVLTTISEQKIDLMIIDYETMRSNKKLQTLVTCDVLAVIPHSEDFIVLEPQNNFNETRLTPKENKKNIIILYDNGDNSDEILRVTSWFTNIERFNLNVIAINRKGLNNDNNKTNSKSKESINDKDASIFTKRRKFFQEAGIELHEIYVTEDIEKDSTKFAKLIIESILKCNPDMIISESYIGKYNLFTNTKFAHLLLSQLNYPIIIVRDYTLPLVSILTHIMMKITGNLGPYYLVRLMKNKIK